MMHPVPRRRPLCRAGVWRKRRPSSTWARASMLNPFFRRGHTRWCGAQPSRPPCVPSPQQSAAFAESTTKISSHVAVVCWACRRCTATSVYVLLAGGVTMALPRSLPVKSGFGFGSQLLKQAGGKESWSLERNPDTAVRRSAVRPEDVSVWSGLEITADYGLEITADDHSR